MQWKLQQSGGWSTGSSAILTFPLHSHKSSARREGSEYHLKTLWYDSAGARTHDLPVVRQMLYHWAITLPLCWKSTLPNTMKCNKTIKLPLTSMIERNDIILLYNIVTFMASFLQTVQQIVLVLNKLYTTTSTWNSTHWLCITSGSLIHSIGFLVDHLMRMPLWFVVRIDFIHVLMLCIVNSQYPLRISNASFLFFL